MNSSFEIIAVLVVGTLVIFLIVGILLAIKLGQAKQKVWSGRSNLKSGNLAAAVTAFREAASISIGTKDFFKLWGGQRDSFDEALEGLATAYHQAGVAINFTQLAELHQRHLRMSERAGAGLMEGSGDELAEVRKLGRNFLDRLPHLPAGARPKNVSPTGGMPPMNVASAAVAATPQSAPIQGTPSRPLSEQLAPPHWTSPSWFEVSLANDMPQRLGFCALIGVAVAALVATPLTLIGDARITFALISVVSLFFGLLAFFATAQRIWPGKTEVECQPMCLSRKVSKTIFGFDSISTHWNDTSWPYSNIQACGIKPPGNGTPFGLLVVCADGEYDLLAIPSDFPLPSLAQYLTARGVRVQQLAEIRPEWIKTWQSQTKWIASGAAAGVALLVLLVASMLPRGAAPKKPGELAANPPEQAPADKSLPNNGTTPPEAKLPGPPMPAVMPSPPPPIKAPVVPSPATPNPFDIDVKPPVQPVAPSAAPSALALHHSWTIPEPALRGFAISPDATRATFYNFGSYVGIAASTAGPVRALSPELSFPTAPVFTPDGNRLYYMNLRGVAAIDPVKGAVLGEMKADTGATLAVSHSGRTLATLTSSSLTVIEGAKPQEPRRIPVTGVATAFLSFSQRDDEVLAWNNVALQAFSCSTGMQREVWKSPDGFHYKLPRMSADSQWLTITSSKKVILVSLADPANARTIELPDYAATNAWPRKNGSQLVFHTSKALVVWDVAAKKILDQVAQPLPSEMYLSADEKFVATRDSSKSVVNVWTLP